MHYRADRKFPDIMLRILLVEDSWADAFFVRETFADHPADLHLHTVPDGETALDYLDGLDDLPDVVLLDMNLPGISGRDVLSQLQRRDASRRVVTVALLGSSGEAEWWIRQGMEPTAFLTKPVDPDELLAVWQQHRPNGTVPRRD